MLRVCTIGRNPTMCHLGLTHRVSVDSLHERCASDDIVLLYEKTEHQAGDIFTRGFVNTDKWKHAAKLINVLALPLLMAMFGQGKATSPEGSATPTFSVPPQVAIPQDVCESSSGPCFQP